jgi:hypothetical protein
LGRRYERLLPFISIYSISTTKNISLAKHEKSPPFRGDLPKNLVYEIII